MRSDAKAKATVADWGMAAHSSTHIHIKAVKCGKAACRVCPHFFYAYARWTAGSNRMERYLGKCNEFGYPERNMKLA